MKNFINFHKKNKSDFTIAAHYKNNVCQSGVLEINNKQQITTFLEKPKLPNISNHWVNAGVYIINPLIIENKIESGFDFGKDLIPSLIDANINIYAYKLNSSIISIDTPTLLNNQLNQSKKGE